MTTFQSGISRYTKVDNYFIDTLNKKKITVLLEKLKKYDLVLAGVFNTDQRPEFNFGIPEQLDSFLTELNLRNKCITTYFGNPYAVSKINSLQSTDGVIVA